MVTDAIVEDIGPRVNNFSETCPADLLEDRWINFNALVINFIHHIHEKTFTIFSNKNVIDICLKFSFRQLLLLLAKLSLQFGDDGNFAFFGLMEGEDILERYCVDCIGMLYDITLVNLFFCLQNFLEGESGIGQIFGHSKFNAVRIVTMQRGKLQLDKFLKQTIFLGIDDNDF
jgi:hypothetical protein